MVVQKKVTAKNVDTLLAILDAPVDISAGRDGVPVTKGRVTDEHHMLAKEMRSENIARKEVAEENLGDLLACSEKLLPGSGQGRPPKISPHPFMRRKLHLDADDKSALKEYHRLQKMEHNNVAQMKVATKKVDNLLAILDSPVDTLADDLPVNKGGVKDEHQTLARELDSESIVWKENFVHEEVAEENVTDLLVCSGELFAVGGHEKLSKISSVGSVCCFSWWCCLPSAVGGQRRFLKISLVRSLCCLSWCCCLSRWFASGREYTKY